MKYKNAFWMGVVWAVMSLSAIFSGSPASAAGKIWSITSPEIKQGQPIPVTYTCQGRNISPPLFWSAPPEKTVSLALVMDDPDAPGGTFTHWMLSIIPKNSKGLRSGIALPSGMVEGKNGFGSNGYSGPCPPPGKAHRYYFRLYALDTELGLKPGFDRDSFDRAVKGHIIAKCELMGTYKRKM